MRLHSFLALAAAGALLMPMAANAGEWPDNNKGDFMDKCVRVATSQQGVTAVEADKHCKCGAQAIEKNFTTAEIKELDSKNGVDAKLQERARAVVTSACAPK